MFSRATALMLVPCLLLMSCSAARQQPPVLAPVMSAELQQAFEGPLCRRLDGVDWPCSDTDGSMWRAWYIQRQARGVLGIGPDRSPLPAEDSSSQAYDQVSITTRCWYGRYFSTCTTRSW